MEFHNLGFVFFCIHSKTNMQCDTNQNTRKETSWLYNLVKGGNVLFNYRNNNIFGEFWSASMPTFGNLQIVVMKFGAIV